jgi:hypothetical protein
MDDSFVSNSVRSSYSEVNSRIRAKTDGSLFTEPAPRPRGYTPISQDGSIAPVYILLWTEG